MTCGCYRHTTFFHTISGLFLSALILQYLILTYSSDAASDYPLRSWLLIVVIVQLAQLPFRLCIGYQLINLQRQFSQSRSQNTATANRCDDCRDPHHATFQRELCNGLFAIVNGTMWKISGWISLFLYGWLFVGSLWALSENNNVSLVTNFNLQTQHKTLSAFTLIETFSTQDVVFYVVGFYIARLAGMLCILLLTLDDRRSAAHELPINIRSASASSASSQPNESSNCASPEPPPFPVLLTDASFRSVSNTQHVFGEPLSSSRRLQQPIPKEVLQKLPIVYYCQNVFPQTLSARRRQSPAATACETTAASSYTCPPGSDKVELILPPPIVKTPKKPEVNLKGRDAQARPKHWRQEVPTITSESSTTRTEVSQASNRITYSSCVVSTSSTYEPLRIPPLKLNSIVCRARCQGKLNVDSWKRGKTELTRLSFSDTRHGLTIQRGRTYPPPLLSTRRCRLPWPSSARPRFRRPPLTHRLTPSRSTGTVAKRSSSCSPLQIHGGKPLFSANCSICLEDYQEGDQITQLPCGHGFHGTCIEVWLLQVDSCPLCQQRCAELLEIFCRGIGEAFNFATSCGNR